MEDNFWRGKRENLMNPNGSYVVDEHHDICVADLTLAPHSMHLFRHIDWVIHLADAVAGISFVFDNQSWLFRENILINTHVVTAASRHKASKFIYVGTACSFPQEVQEFGTVEDPAALDEDQVYPAHPESSYGWSKLMGEYEVSLLQKMNASVLRRVFYRAEWRARRDSNPRPSAPEADALSAELRALEPRLQAVTVCRTSGTMLG